MPNLRRPVLGCSMLLAVAGAVFGQAAPEAAPAPAPATNQTTEALANSPQIVFESERAVLGSVLDTDIRTVTFKFRNVGGSDLRIGEATTLTEYVAPQPMPKRTFAPGESGEISFRIDPRQWRGAITTTMDLPTNSIGAPVQLAVDVFVEPTIILEPARLRIGWVKPGHIARLSLGVIGRTSDFNVTEARIGSQGGQVWQVTKSEPAAFEINGEARRRVNIELNSVTPLPEGQLAEMLVLTTNDKRKPEVQVPISAWVGERPPPRIEVSPTLVGGDPVDGTRPVRIKDAMPRRKDLPVPDSTNPGAPQANPDPAAPAPAPAPAPEKPKAP